MATQISVMSAVSDGNSAISFYKAAFGAELLWHLEDNGHVVAGLSIDGAKFFLADESPSHGTRAPASVGFTTVRIELFVDDPRSTPKSLGCRSAGEQSSIGTRIRDERPTTDRAHASRRSCRSVRAFVAGWEVSLADLFFAVEKKAHAQAKLERDTLRVHLPDISCLSVYCG